LARWAQEAYWITERHAARIVKLGISTLRYESRKVFDEVLRRRLRELAGTYVRYGYRRLTVLLRREGWQMNAKRIYRLYREEELIVRTKQRDHVQKGHVRGSNGAFELRCGCCKCLSHTQKTLRPDLSTCQK